MSEVKQTVEDAINQYELSIIKEHRITLKGHKKTKEKMAIEIIRYAVVNLLGWSAEETRDHLTLNIMKQLKLYPQLTNYINFPPDIDKEQDMNYYACLIFPDLQFDNTKQTLLAYHRILRGEMPGFRKNFFKGKNGYHKINILLREFIANNLSVNSTEELYLIFSNTNEISRKLNKAKLLTTVNRLYGTPLEALHESLIPEDRDDFLYNVYSYLTAYRIYVSEIGEQHGLTMKSIKNSKPKKHKIDRK